jgi:RNA polymerase sigma factor (TIGR02999 family)
MQNPESLEVKDTTELLINWSNGDKEALRDLIPLVYGELHRLAAIYLQSERTAHTLQPTALVHEAYLRLIDQNRVQWRNRAHFLGVAAQVLRRVLVDHARAKQTAKRGAGVVAISLNEERAAARTNNLDLVGLNDALNELESLDPQQMRIVELRFFAGVSIEETAESLEISPATVKRDWALARAWLFRRLNGEAASPRNGP